MIRHKRVFWGMHNGIKRYQLLWPEVSKRSVVLISASEGPPPEFGEFVVTPNRFVGDAVFTVHQIAPDAGSVFFVVEIDWPEPLGLWTDATLFDPDDPIETMIGSHQR